MSRHRKGGVKLAAHGKGLIQEVFVITTDREAVRKLLA